MSLTVIVPFYNDSQYLENCILSLKRQDLGEFSVMLIDDGSTDGSAQICKKYTENDERFTLISLEHHGVSHSRNYGLQHAECEFVTFVDADDEIEPEHMRRLVENMSNPAVCMAVTGMRYVTEEKQVVFQLLFQDKTLSLDQALNSSFEHGGIGGFVWNKIFRTGIIKRNSIQFDESLRKYEDHVFVINYLLATSGSVITASSASYTYIKHDDSVILAIADSTLSEDLVPYNMIDLMLKNSAHVGANSLVSDAKLNIAFSRLRKHSSTESDQQAKNYIIENLLFRTIFKRPTTKAKIRFALMWIYVRVF